MQVIYSKHRRLRGKVLTDWRRREVVGGEVRDGNSTSERLHGLNGLKMQAVKVAFSCWGWVGWKWEYSVRQAT